MLEDLRNSFDALEHVAGEIVLRQPQQLFDCRFAIDLDEAIRKLRLPQSHHFVKTLPQTFLRALVHRVTFAETMNHRAFQSRRQICRRLGRFGVVPDRHLLRRRQLQHAIEVVLPRASLVVDQLRDAEAVNRVAALWAKRADERKGFTQRVGRVHRLLQRFFRRGFKLFGFLSKIHGQLQLNIVRELNHTARADGPANRATARSTSATNRSSLPSVAISSVTPERINRSSARDAAT